MSAENNAEAGE